MYVRNCPRCNSVINYSYKPAWHKANNKNSLCKKCAVKSHKKSKYEIKTRTVNGRIFYIRECPTCVKEIQSVNYRKYWDALKYNKSCKSCSATKRYNLDSLSNCEYKNGNRLFYRICSHCNSKIYYKNNYQATALAKKMHTCKVCAAVRQKYIFPNYNPLACKLIDEYGKLHGYNFQHALNGGEFLVPNTRYYVDGYDKEKNVVIEIDELHHKYNAKQDAIRQQKIITELKCIFIRIPFSEYNNTEPSSGNIRTVSDTK